MKSSSANLTSEDIGSPSGIVMVISIALIVLALTFAAIGIDLGYIMLTKAQLQNAADAGAYAAADQMTKCFGVGAEMTPAQSEAHARQTAADLVALHGNLDVDAIPFTASRDVRFGNRYLDEVTGEYVETWGIAPYNVVEVTTRRSDSDNTALNLFFADTFGSARANVSATAVAAVKPISGFSFNSPNGTVNLLPFAVDLPSWEYLLDVRLRRAVSPPSIPLTISDSYSFNEATGAVVQSPDGIPELNIYPHTNNSLPPGNRGTVDLGAPNNSTNDLKRQILYGLHATDFSYFPDNRISVEDGPIFIQGDTGISAGMGSELESIVGQTRAIPVFLNVYGNGNNAMYEVVKFVGIRVMSAKLNGSPAHRRLIVQPANLYMPSGVSSDQPIAVDSILAAPTLIR